MRPGSRPYIIIDDLDLDTPKASQFFNDVLNLNKPNYMKTILTDQEVKDMFSSANRNAQVMLRELFGDEQLGLRGQSC